MIMSSKQTEKGFARQRLPDVGAHAYQGLSAHFYVKLPYRQFAITPIMDLTIVRNTYTSWSGTSSISPIYTVDNMVVTKDQ